MMLTVTCNMIQVESHHFPGTWFLHLSKMSIMYPILLICQDITDISRDTCSEI